MGTESVVNAGVSPNGKFVLEGVNRAALEQLWMMIYCHR